MYAARARDGARSWRTHIGGIVVADFLVTGRHVYAPDGMCLNVIDRRSGRFAARVAQPGGAGRGLFASPAVEADGRVVVSVADGTWRFAEP